MSVITVSQSLCSGNPYLLNNASKPKSSDAGNLDIPKRSHKVIPLIENVCMFSKKQKNKTKTKTNKTKNNNHSIYKA